MKENSIMRDVDSNVVLIVMYIVAMILYLLPVCKFFAWVIPLLVYLFEVKNKYVRRQASQSMMLFIIGALFALVIYLVSLALVPVTYIQYSDVTLSGFRNFLFGVVNVISIIGTIIIFTFSIISMVRVYNYYDYSIPVLGRYINSFRKVLDKIVGNVDNDDMSVNVSSVNTDTLSGIMVGELFENSNYKETKKSGRKKKAVVDEKEV